MLPEQRRHVITADVSVSRFPWSKYEHPPYVAFLFLTERWKQGKNGDRPGTIINLGKCAGCGSMEYCAPEAPWSWAQVDSFETNNCFLIVPHSGVAWWVRVTNIWSLWRFQNALYFYLYFSSQLLHDVWQVKWYALSLNDKRLLWPFSGMHFPPVSVRNQNTE